MARLTRVLQKIFGGSLTPTGNIAVVGSLAAGAPSFSNDAAVIQSLSQYLNGWGACTTGTQSPALQDMNGLFYLITRQLAYVMQSGIPEYESTTTYYIGNWVLVAGVAYISKTDNNVGHNPVSDTNNWQTLAQQLTGATVNPAALPRAWVNFNGAAIAGSGGGGLPIRSSYNVSAVNKVAGQTSLYEVVLNGSFPDTNYCFQITSGVAANTFADFPREGLKLSDRIQFYSLAQNSQQGQSPECNVTFFSSNALT